MASAEPLLCEGQAKPFLKWAGGKSQLLPALRALYPQELRTGKIHRYIEPFLGGGALFFDVMQGYSVDEAHLFDINEELILTYSVVKHDPLALADALAELRARYLAREPDERRLFFYEIRSRYNEARFKIDLDQYGVNWVVRAAQMIFLNKTCFNGLYRVNRSGAFNVPFGGYRNPLVFVEDNLHAVSRLLSRATLHRGSYADCAPYVTDETFVYFDPPYRPLSKTASFTSYSRSEFGDTQQKQLAAFVVEMNQRTKAKLMLSNSDPKHADRHDLFFDTLYAELEIQRVLATRMINSDGEGRGKINEIVVTNYHNQPNPCQKPNKADDSTSTSVNINANTLSALRTLSEKC